MAHISIDTVNRVREAIQELAPATNQDIATVLDIHSTTAGEALRKLAKKGEVTRVRPSRGTRGQQPFVWFLSSQDIPDTLQTETTERVGVKTTRPAHPTGVRSRRNSTHNTVRDELRKRSPRGKPFTAYEITEKIGTMSYESVRKSFTKMIEAGELVQLDKCKKGSRQYRVTDKLTGTETPTAAPTVTPATVGASPAGHVQALIDERNAIVARIHEDGQRLVAINTELNELRSLLS